MFTKVWQTFVLLLMNLCSRVLVRYGAPALYVARVFLTLDPERNKTRHALASRFLNGLITPAPYEDLVGFWTRGDISEKSPIWPAFRQLCPGVDARNEVQIFVLSIGDEVFPELESVASVARSIAFDRTNGVPEEIIRNFPYSDSAEKAWFQLTPERAQKLAVWTLQKEEAPIALERATDVLIEQLAVEPELEPKWRFWLEIELERRISSALWPDSELELVKSGLRLYRKSKFFVARAIDSILRHADELLQHDRGMALRYVRIPSELIGPALEELFESGMSAEHVMGLATLLEGPPEYHTLRLVGEDILDHLSSSILRKSRGAIQYVSEGDGRDATYKNLLARADGPLLAAIAE